MKAAHRLRRGRARLDDRRPGRDASPARSRRRRHHDRPPVAASRRPHAAGSVGGVRPGRLTTHVATDAASSTKPPTAVHGGPTPDLDHGRVHARRRDRPRRRRARPRCRARRPMRRHPHHASTIAATVSSGTNGHHRTSTPTSTVGREAESLDQGEDVVAVPGAAPGVQPRQQRPDDRHAGADRHRDHRGAVTTDHADAAGSSASTVTISGPGHAAHGTRRPGVLVSTVGERQRAQRVSSGPAGRGGHRRSTGDRKPPWPSSIEVATPSTRPSPPTPPSP